MLYSKFLMNNQGLPISFFHGTCAEFNQFLPLSHFTPDEQIAAKYCSPIRAPFEYSANGTEIGSHIDILRKFIVTSHFEKKPGKVIPVYLRIFHPFKKQYNAENYAAGSIYAYLKEIGQTNHAMTTYSNAQVDFIFKNPFEMMDDQVAHELALETLYAVSSKPELNKSHLVKQRLIQFWESCGYDGFRYTLGNNQSTYVAFRPDQVYRLDKPDSNLDRSITSTKNKIELNKIRYLYLRSHRPHKISIVETIERVGALDLWQRD